MIDPKKAVEIDEDRFAIATNPEYIDRCRESYAFADFLGCEYNGVVFR